MLHRKKRARAPGNPVRLLNFEAMAKSSLINESWSNGEMESWRMGSSGALLHDSSSPNRPLFPGVDREEFFLRLVHLRVPHAFLFVELNGGRMVWQRDIGAGRALPRPVLEVRVERRELGDVVPDRFQRPLHDRVGQPLMPDHVNVVGEAADVLENAGGRSGLEVGEVI